MQQMSASYSANKDLHDLGQNLGFKVYIFDDPGIFGPEIKLRENTKNGEIDAILIYEESSLPRWEQ